MNGAIWVAFDTETTGLDPGSRLVELAAVAFTSDGSVLGTFSRLCHPQMPMPSDIIGISGIDDHLLAAAPPAGEALQDFFAWLPPEALLLAHNARYDCDILGYECDRVGIPVPTLPVIDTLALARRLQLPCGNRLQALREHFHICVDGEAHRALPDAETTRQVFLRVQELLPEKYRASREKSRPLTPRWHFPRVGPPGFDLLVAACRQRTPLRFHYRDAHGGRSHRSIEAWSYARTARGLRFHGLCHLRQDRRNFAFERCSDLQLNA